MQVDSPSVRQLSAAELKQRLERGERLTLVDVREEDERTFAAIAVPPTAADLHVPMAQVAARFNDLSDAAQEAPLVVYCHLGVRSMAVASWLASQGLAGVANLEGGIDAWSIEADPRVRRY
jgi:rhodanese-related sulfurtransferase